jgi:hypothetical protein
MNADVAGRNSFRVWWPLGLAGLLFPLGTIQIHRWLPLWVASSIAFAVLFSAAGALVQRQFPVPERNIASFLRGAVGGAAVAAALTYFFPWA